MIRRVTLASFAGLALAMAACGGSDSPTTTSGDAGAGDPGGGGAGGKGGGGGDGGQAAVPRPQAGITACNAAFVDADKVCRPTIEKCKGGTIPNFTKGCVHTGIRTCGAAFLGADGFCHATMDKCLSGTFAVPSKGCVSIDAAGCGTDTYGMIAAADGDQYVDPTYEGGASDGTRAAPWTTIADALSAVAVGKRVVLAAGNYAEPIAPTQSVTVAGRCASMVTVSGTTGAGASKAIISAKSVTGALRFEGMTLKGDGAGAFITGSNATFQSVFIDGALGEGIHFGQSAIGTVQDVFVRGTRPLPDGKLGAGMSVIESAQVVIAQSAFFQAHSWGIDVYNRAKVTITDSLIQGTVLDVATGQFGYGIVVEGLGSLVADNVDVVGTEGTGISVFDPVVATVKDTNVEKASGKLSLGVDVERTVGTNSGYDLQADGLAVLGTDGIGVSVYNQAKANLTRTLVADGVAVKQVTAIAFYVDSGSLLAIGDSAAVNNVGFGVSAHGTGTQFFGSGFLIEGQKERTTATAQFGEGAAFTTGVVAKLSRTASIHNVFTGFSVYSGANLTVADSLVSDTQAASVQEPGVGGEGLYAYGATLSASTLLVEKSRAAGVQIAATATNLRNVVVDGVAMGTALIISNAGDQALPGVGDGVIISQNQSLEAKLQGVWVSGAARAGFLFSGVTGSVDGSFAEKGQYGLVTEGSPLPTIGADNAFSGTVMDVMKDGKLPSP